MKKFSYKIILLRMSNNVLIVEKIIKKRKLSSKIMELGGRTFHVPTENPAYLNGLEFVYFLNVDDGKIYSFKEIKSLDPNALDLLFRQHIVEQIASGLKERNNGIDWKWFIMGALIGALGGALVIMYIMQKRIDELIIELSNPVFIPV